MEKITVVIPNYNGRDLLAKNLPYVIKNCSNCKIIIVDDASTDDSVQLIHKKFKKVKVIRLKKNLGFSGAANKGVGNAQTDLVLLLNSDVRPRKDFIKPLIKYFQYKDTFSVGIEDQSHEGGKIIPRGRGGAEFKRGFIYHYPATIERGESLWASGGSALFSRGKFLELGGFDSLYKPFYWEDIDLGFRSWRSGYKVYFEPLSKVDHFHEEGAIQKSKTTAFVTSVSYKNQFLFFWKNIDDYSLIFFHFAWLPYHIIRALISMDISFFLGLVWAIASIPKLIMTADKNNFIISAKEVLRKFKKQNNHANAK